MPRNHLMGLIMLIWIKRISSIRIDLIAVLVINSIVSLTYIDNITSSQDDCETDFSYSKDLMSFLDEEINSLKNMEIALENLITCNDMKSDNSKCTEQSSRRKKIAVSNFVTIDLINNKSESVNKGRTFSSRK